MWIVIIIVIAILVVIFIMSSLGSEDQIYYVYDETGKEIFSGSPKLCADYMQYLRMNGYKGRLKTKRYKGYK